VTATARGDLVLESGGARIVVSPLDGGRLASVTVGGLELLSGGPADGPMGWGSYPMVPWAGRIRHGRFAFGGREHRLPLGLPPHAIHGVVYDRPWTIVDAATIAIDLDERWPYRGRVTQRFAVEPGGLEVALTVEAGEPMPATVGWHPWFRRTLVPGDPRVELRFDAATMLVRDAEGMPSGERVAPTPGPWDDAFTDLRADPVLTWPGRLQVELASSCPWWVVYSMPEHAICVEPQSGPPDAVNLELAELAEPGRPLVHAMRWRWTRL
jgi:aldose 1-epimerase